MHEDVAYVRNTESRCMYNCPNTQNVPGNLAIVPANCPANHAKIVLHFLHWDQNFQNFCHVLGLHS